MGNAMTARLKTVWRIIVIGLYLIFGWVVGLVWLVAGVLRAIAQWRRARKAVAPSIVCPWCHASVSQYGAFSCPSCHQKTLGWAWECSACGQVAGFVDCPECQLSIANPLVR
jgi:hypothetical protein